MAAIIDCFNVCACLQKCSYHIIAAQSGSVE